MTAGATRFEDVSHHLEGRRGDVAVLERCSFALRPGEIVAMIGPSGCGKSTIGHLLAGYERPTAGRILVDDRPVRGPSAERLLLFQENALMPWLTTLDNVMFGPSARGADKRHAVEQATELLGRMGLQDFLHRYPGELSGGMRRRAELARALINQPRVLILDEPFRGLDAMTRELMQEYTAALLTEERRTTLFITTDVDEALLLADRVLVMAPRPTHVLTELTIDAARPRERTALLTDQHAQDLKGEVLGLLSGRSQAAIPSH